MIIKLEKCTLLFIYEAVLDGTQTAYMYRNHEIDISFRLSVFSSFYFEEGLCSKYPYQEKPWQLTNRRLL